MDLLVVILAVVFGLGFARFAVRPMIDQLNHQQRVLRRRQLGMDFGDDSSQHSSSANSRSSNNHNRVSAH
jgi:hypothetical protein